MLAVDHLSEDQVDGLAAEAKNLDLDASRAVFFVLDSKGLLAAEHLGNRESETRK